MIDKVLQIFSIEETIGITDTFSLYELRLRGKLNLENVELFTEEFYSSINSEISSFGYDWELEIEELDFVIGNERFKSLDEFSNVDDDLTITYKVFKKTNTVFIVDETVFYENLKNKSLYELLSIFKKYPSGIRFVIPNSSCQTANSYISINDEVNTNTFDISLSSQCLYSNKSEFNFNPTQFYFPIKCPTNDLYILLEKLSLIFTLIYISDYSEIHNDTLTIKISGLKTLEYDIKFEVLNIDSVDEYRKIFEWIYSEKNKTEDKLGIAKNILSVYLTASNIDIKESVFSSILSANKAYLKSNINKYVEVRNKIHEQLTQISSKINSSLETFFSNFQKTIFIFISFYLTVFIAKFYSRTEVTAIINKEATIMALGLLVLSAVFLVFSYLILNLEKKRIKEKYIEIKERHQDILIGDDIEKILRNDEEFNSELSFLDNRKTLYIYLWIATLIIFLVIILSTSDYMNFKYIGDESDTIIKNTSCCNTNNK